MLGSQKQCGDKIEVLVVSFHSIEYPLMYSFISSFMNCMSFVFRYETKIPSAQVLKQEVEEMESALSQAESPVVFSHNDALCANFIYNKDQGQ